MARRRINQMNEQDDWARQVPEHRWRGPYDDYGWESGQSGLPNFRDPDVERMPWENPDDPMERRWHGDEWDVPGPYWCWGSSPTLAA